MLEILFDKRFRFGSDDPVELVLLDWGNSEANSCFRLSMSAGVYLWWSVPSEYIICVHLPPCDSVNYCNNVLIITASFPRNPNNLSSDRRAESFRIIARRVLFPDFSELEFGCRINYNPDAHCSVV